MAVKYPITNGNWSNAAIWNGGTLPTSADDVYANNFTVTIDISVTVLSIRNTAQTPAVAGGSFILNNGITVNCTSGGMIIGGAQLLSYSGSGSVTINSSFSGISSGTNISGFVISGTGTVTINGAITGSTSSVTAPIIINVTGAAVLNIVGNITGYSSGAVNSTSVRMGTSGSILNVVGNIEARGTQKETVILLTGTTLNLTGNAFVGFNTANSAKAISAATSTINITGDVYVANTSGTNTLMNALTATNACTINITGNVYSDSSSTSSTGGSVNAVIIGGNASYYKHIGTLTAGYRDAGFVCTVTNAINIMSGPFISGVYGTAPFQVARMNYFRTLGSYYEFRDETTNGALPPSAAAPAARMVSPNTIVDSPIPANVRQGISYALGSLTGTLKVPAPGSVALGVPTDNTVGTAVLTPAAVWDYATASITDPNSIGARVKNTSTVDTTGSQLAALLNS
jgi:hypothetical protein